MSRGGLRPSQLEPGLISGEARTSDRLDPAGPAPAGVFGHRQRPRGSSPAHTRTDCAIGVARAAPNTQSVWLASTPRARLAGDTRASGSGHVGVAGIWVGGSVLSVYGRAEQVVLVASG